MRIHRLYRFAMGASTILLTFIVLGLPLVDGQAPPAVVTPSPSLEDKASSIKERRDDAQKYFDTGRYDLARKRYDQVLALDPYNDAAKLGKQRTEQAHSELPPAPTQDYPGKGHLMYPVLIRDTPVQRLSRLGKLRSPAAAYDNQIGVSAAVSSLTKKLQSIIIPHAEFRQTSLRDAVEYLRQESRRLDSDPDVDRRGVNIFIKFPAPPPQTGIVESIPGLPLAAATPAVSQLPLSAANPQSLISITMDRLPLLEALRHVAKQAGMKVQVEPYAVSIVPLVNSTLVTAEYLVPPELLGLSSDLNVQYPGESISMGHSISSAGGDRSFTIRSLNRAPWFDSKGVSFPPGATAIYLLSTGKLVVRNTQENLDKIVALVFPALPTPTPTPTNP